MQPGSMPKTQRTCRNHPGEWYGSIARWGLVLAVAILSGGALFTGIVAAQTNVQANSSQTNSVQTNAARAPAVKHRKKPATSHASVAATDPPAQPAPPPPPPLPDWPVNDRPSDAKVIWDSKGLSIEAANSSLSQILNEVASKTGATLQGFNRDERIFGVYGPGSARDVINQLLDGTGYNVLMIGDQGQGTPRQILLTPRSAGAPQPSKPNNPAPEEDTEVEQEAQQPELPPAQPPVPTGTAPAVPLRTQPEMIQELQERQRQIQQQQQQQQNPQ
jgi:hypothetical protein